MWNPAETMPFARFGSVEPLFDGAEITNRYVGLLHFRHPILELIARKNASNDRAQLFPIGRSRPARGKVRISDEIGPIKDFGHKASIQPVVGTGHVERPVGRLIQADG